MYKVIKTLKRKDTQTKFFFEIYQYPQEYLTYVKKNYLDTGKLLRYQKQEMSQDGLSISFITEWKSRSDCLDSSTDDYLYNYLIKELDYTINNDIELSINIEKE